MVTDVPIISADSHITEPPDTYTARIDARFKDRAPRLVHDAKRGDRQIMPQSWIESGAGLWRG